MSIRLGAGAWRDQAVLAVALAATLSGVYLGLPWPRLALQAGVLACGLLWLARRRGLAPAGLVPEPVRVASWVFLLVLLASSLASTEIAVSLDATALAAAYLVIVVAAASLLPSVILHRRSAARILLLLVLSGVGMVFTGFIFSWAGAADLHGAFGNKNHFAGYLLLLLPLALTGLFRATGRTQVTAFGAAAVLMGCGLLLSQSRGAWLAFVFGLTAVVSLQWRKRDTWLRLASAGLLAVALSLILDRAALQTTALAGLAAVQDVAVATSGQPPDGTLGPRLDYWQGALAIAHDYPFLGTGPGTFASVFPSYQSNPNYYSKYAHQVLLQTLAEAGAPGLLVLLGLLAAFAWSVARGLPARLIDPGSPASVLAVGLAGGLLSSLAHNLVELDWYVPAIAVLAAAEAGLLLALTRKGDGTNAGQEAVTMRRPVEVRRAALIVCLAGLVWTGVRAAEAWELAVGSDAMGRGDTVIAAAAYRGAAVLDPLSADPQKALATLALSREGNAALPPALYPGEGLEAARRAVALASRDVDAWVLLARAYQTRAAVGDADRSLEALAAAAALRHPAQARELYSALIQGYLEAGRPGEAGELCRRVLADFGLVTPGTVDAAYVAQAYVWLGNLAASRGEIAGAADQYRSAVALDAGNAAGWFDLGVVLLEDGQAAVARDALVAAVRLDPGQAVVHYYLGVAQDALGDRSAARAELEAALTLDSGCQACRELLNRLPTLP
jgi:putative inorganic carbon (hco3(-)) transporter